MDFYALPTDFLLLYRPFILAHHRLLTESCGHFLLEKTLKKISSLSPPWLSPPFKTTDRFPLVEPAVTQLRVASSCNYISLYALFLQTNTESFPLSPMREIVRVRRSLSFSESSPVRISMNSWSPFPLLIQHKPLAGTPNLFFPGQQDCRRDLVSLIFYTVKPPFSRHPFFACFEDLTSPLTSGHNHRVIVLASPNIGLLLLPPLLARHTCAVDFPQDSSPFLLLPPPRPNPSRRSIRTVHRTSVVLVLPHP